MTNKEIIVLDLNDFPLPIYGIDEENDNGIPVNAKLFYDEIETADGIILSLVEHNGNFSAIFKNLFDWMSRIEQKIRKNIPMLLMATSSGGRGGASVINVAKNGFPYYGGNIVSEFSLPKFYENFKDKQITNIDLLEKLKKVIHQFEISLHQ